MLILTARRILFRPLWTIFPLSCQPDLPKLGSRTLLLSAFPGFTNLVPLLWASVSCSVKEGGGRVSGSLSCLTPRCYFNSRDRSVVSDRDGLQPGPGELTLSRGQGGVGPHAGPTADLHPLSLFLSFSFLTLLSQKNPSFFSA